MGEELVHILETQRQMENKFEELTLDGGGGKMSGKDVTENAHGVFAATEGPLALILNHGGMGWLFMHCGNVNTATVDIGMKGAPVLPMFRP